MNDIQTWQQGHFVDSPRYDRWTAEERENAERDENLKVRPGPTENAICVCNNPEHAKWIAQRLNLASKLEDMTYNFATGKTDGQDIVDYVHKCVNS